jgi:predicted CopG family antitoxin
MKYVKFQKPLTIALTAEIYSEILEMSEDQKVSMADVIRTILSRYLKYRKKTEKNVVSN